MKVYVLEREQFIRAPSETVFAFHSNAENLEAITPSWVGFEVLSPTPITMRVDARIDYRLRLAGVPMRWRTRVTSFEPERGFVDEQEFGPYALWEHTHRFEVMAQGVLVTDRVRYALPLGPLGRLAHALVIQGTLARIFDFRFRRTRELLEPGASAAPD